MGKHSQKNQNNIEGGLDRMRAAFGERAAVPTMRVGAT